MMKVWVSLFNAVVLCALTACTPALNWREARLDAGEVVAMLPCKPDVATRQVDLQQGTVAFSASLQLQGCEAGGFQWTLGRISLPPDVLPATAMAAWQQASMAPMQARAQDAQPVDWWVAGALQSPQPVRLKVKTALHQAQLGWFARGNKVYQLAVYGPAQAKGLDDTADIYFSGIKLP